MSTFKDKRAAVYQLWYSRDLWRGSFRIMASLIGYIRVSTESQRDNTSLEVQRERIEAYCKAHGHTLKAVFWDVQSGSGTKRRHGFLEAISLIKRGSAEGLIAMKIDRFARSVLDGLTVAADLNSHGKQLVLIDCNLDTSTAIGKCIFTVLLAFAQFERDAIISRCDEGIRKKQSVNGYIAGRPPFGFQHLDGKLVAVPEQLKWREQVLEWHKEGVSNAEIARNLNNLGVTTKTGKRFAARSIIAIIDNDVLRRWYRDRERLERDRAESTG